MAAGRRSQAVGDLDAAAVWLALEADHPDGWPVGQADDPVGAERPLLSARGRGAREAADDVDRDLEGETVRPSITWPRTSCDDAFSLCDIDRVKLQPRSSEVGHGASEAAPIAKRHRVSPALRRHYQPMLLTRSRSTVIGRALVDGPRRRVATERRLLPVRTADFPVQGRSRTNAQIIGARPDNLCWSPKVGLFLDMAAEIADYGRRLHGRRDPAALSFCSHQDAEFARLGRWQSSPCRCGAVIHTSREVPHPTELLMIADREIGEDTSDGAVQMPHLYARMNHVFPCSQCGRLWSFENGMDTESPFPTLGSLTRARIARLRGSGHQARGARDESFMSLPLAAETVTLEACRSRSRFDRYRSPNRPTSSGCRSARKDCSSSAKRGCP